MMFSTSLIRDSPISPMKELFWSGVIKGVVTRFNSPEADGWTAIEN